MLNYRANIAHYGHVPKRQNPVILTVMNRHTNVVQSTSSALRGHKHGMSGRNFRIQLAIGIITLFFAYYLPLTTTDREIIILLVAIVLAAELFNSAIEELADTLIQEHHVGIAKVKELAAGAVLLVAIAAAIIGLYIFIPYL